MFNKDFGGKRKGSDSLSYFKKGEERKSKYVGRISRTAPRL